MTTLAHRSALAGSRNGGIAARRAVVRWARRLVRREWRQQLLVLTLLTVSVAAAIGSITIAYNAVPADDGEFGSANALLTFDGSDTRELEAGLDAARKSFRTIDVVGHRSVPVPGGIETVDYRAQDPDGAYSGDLLALRRGSYPTRPGEVAVTDGVAESLQLQIGSTLALDGRRQTVVGIVENPSKLSDEFALVSPASARSDHVDVLVDASPASIRSFFESLGEPPGALMSSMEQGSDVGGTAETLAMFSVATVFLLLASLVAAAGFAVVAQRRLRQLGMLAAVGATQKHLRLVLLTNGAVVGTVAAVLGTIAGLALWVAFAPTLESAVDHRIERLGLPWGDRRRLVARASRRPPPGRPRALRATPQAEARAPLGSRGRGPDRGRHRVSHTVQPRQTAAHRRRDPGDHLRHAAPRTADDPHFCPNGRTRPRRRAPGAARPRPVSGSLRSGSRRHHPGPRDCRGRRGHCGSRGEAGRGPGGREPAEPVRQPDPGVHGCNARPGPHSHAAPDARPARTERCARPPTRRSSRSGNRDTAPEGVPTRRTAHRHLRGR